MAYNYPVPKGASGAFISKEGQLQTLKNGTVVNLTADAPVMWRNLLDVIGWEIAPSSNYWTWNDNERTEFSSGILSGFETILEDYFGYAGSLKLIPKENAYKGNPAYKWAEGFRPNAIRIAVKDFDCTIKVKTVDGLTLKLDPNCVRSAYLAPGETLYPIDLTSDIESVEICEPLPVGLNPPTPAPLAEARWVDITDPKYWYNKGDGSNGSLSGTYDAVNGWWVSEDGSIDLYPLSNKPINANNYEDVNYWSKGLRFSKLRVTITDDQGAKIYLNNLNGDFLVPNVPYAGGTELNLDWVNAGTAADSDLMEMYFYSTSGIPYTITKIEIYTNAVLLEPAVPVASWKNVTNSKYWNSNDPSNGNYTPGTNSWNIAGGDGTLSLYALGELNYTTDNYNSSQFWSKRFRPTKMRINYTTPTVDPAEFPTLMLYTHKDGSKINEVVGYVSGADIVINWDDLADPQMAGDLGAIYFGTYQVQGTNPVTDISVEFFTDADLPVPQYRQLIKLEFLAPLKEFRWLPTTIGWADYLSDEYFDFSLDYGGSWVNGVMTGVDFATPDEAKSRIEVWPQTVGLGWFGFRPTKMRFEYTGGSAGLVRTPWWMYGPEPDENESISSSSNGHSGLEEVLSYFSDEQNLMIAGNTDANYNYDTKVGGFDIWLYTFDYLPVTGPSNWKVDFTRSSFIGVCELTTKYDEIKKTWISTDGFPLCLLSTKPIFKTVGGNLLVRAKTPNGSININVQTIDSVGVITSISIPLSASQEENDYEFTIPAGQEIYSIDIPTCGDGAEIVAIGYALEGARTAPFKMTKIDFYNDIEIAKLSVIDPNALGGEGSITKPVILGPAYNIGVNAATFSFRVQGEGYGRLAIYSDAECTTQVTPGQTSWFTHRGVNSIRTSYLTSGTYWAKLFFDLNYSTVEAGTTSNVSEIVTYTTLADLEVWAPTITRITDITDESFTFHFVSLDETVNGMDIRFYRFNGDVAALAGNYTYIPYGQVDIAWYANDVPIVSGNGSYTIDRSKCAFIPGSLYYLQVSSVRLAGGAGTGWANSNPSNLVHVLIEPKLPTTDIQALVYEDVVWTGLAYVAVCSGHTDIAMRSTTGKDWTQSRLPALGNWMSVASNGENCCAVSWGQNSTGSGNELNIAVGAKDGSTWSNSDISGILNNIAAGQQLGSCKVIVNPQNQGYIILFSNGMVAQSDTMGFSWTLSKIDTVKGPTDSWVDICYGPGYFVAMSEYDDRTAWSTDGKDWTTVAHNVATRGEEYSGWWLNIAYNGHVFVAVSTDGLIMCSPDGVTDWKITYQFEMGTEICGLAVGGMRFVVTLNGQLNWGKTYTSVDGVCWTRSENKLPYNSIRSLVYANGEFVALGGDSSNGCWIGYAEDGSKWSKISKEVFPNYPFAVAPRKRWYDVIDERIWGSSGPLLPPGCGTYFDITGNYLTKDISYKEDINWDATAVSISNWGDSELIAGAFFGKDNTWDIWAKEKSWRPTKIRIAWEPANVPVQLWAWDDNLVDIIDYDIIYTGGYAEMDITWRNSGSYIWMDDFGIGTQTATGVNEKSFKLTMCEMYGDDPAYYYRVPATPELAKIDGYWKTFRLQSECAVVDGKGQSKVGNRGLYIGELESIADPTIVQDGFGSAATNGEALSLQITASTQSPTGQRPTKMKVVLKNDPNDTNTYKLEMFNSAGTKIGATYYNREYTNIYYQNQKLNTVQPGAISTVINMEYPNALECKKIKVQATNKKANNKFSIEKIDLFYPPEPSTVQTPYEVSYLQKITRVIGTDGGNGITWAGFDGPNYVAEVAFNPALFATGVKPTGFAISTNWVTGNDTNTYTITVKASDNNVVYTYAGLWSGFNNIVKSLPLLATKDIASIRISVSTAGMGEGWKMTELDFSFPIV